jgi:N-acetylglucosamine-6-phosphate deacetylase
MTFAPELPGAGELLATLNARGIVAACGHSDADAAEAHAAFDRGATHVTHLFNALRPFGHRAPGLTGVALARDDVTVELILDGNHLADETVRLAWRAAAGRVVLVTDAIAAAGVRDREGRWHLGAVDVDVRDGVVRDSTACSRGRADDSTRRNLIDAGATPGRRSPPPLSSRHAARSTTWACCDRTPADIVVLEGDVRVSRVIVSGVGR